MAPTTGYAAQAFALRRRTIQVLAPNSPEEDVSFPPAPEEAWQLFLKIEQCAAPLKRSLGSRAPQSTVLDQFATDDIQRSLAARAQLSSLATLARQHAWTIVVLKGSVGAADGRPSHAQDLDILVEPGQAAQIARAIGTHLGLDPAGRVKSRHLPIMGAAFSLPIEVHVSIDAPRTPLTRTAWSRIIPLESVPGLFRLGPPDHSLHLLTHMVIDHPDRRGRLRDTLLLRSALKECSDLEVEELTRELGRRRNGYAELLLDQLRFARGSVAVIDSFDRAAFTSYWMAERSLPWRRHRFRNLDHVYPTVWQGVLIQSVGWPMTPWLRDSFAERPADRSEIAFIAFLERRVPLLGRIARLALRGVHYAIALLVAWPLALSARRAARNAGVETAR